MCLQGGKDEIYDQIGLQQDTNVTNSWFGLVERCKRRLIKDESVELRTWKLSSPECKFPED